MPEAEYDVVVVGAGPVGLTLALDLGRRGVRCLLVERNTAPVPLPKMERCNGRTMEIYRRLGVAEAVRAAGLPREVPMDVFLAGSMAGPVLAQIACPSVAAAEADIAAHNDGTRLREPYQLISQYTLEPLLRTIVEAIPTVEVRFGHALQTFTVDPGGVSAMLTDAAGARSTVRAAYLVGCDGGSSTVRKQLGFALHGEGSIRTLRQALFYSPDLFERIPIGRGRHYHIATPPVFPFIILQDSTRHWTLHAAAETDAEMTRLFGDALGMALPFETLNVTRWTQHLLCAERFQAERVFIAGDAAHLVIPTGGLGMNTGVGDAIDLGWKLAARLAGWGGPRLLASYAAERRPIALRNIRASGAAMQGRLSWRAATSAADMAARFAIEQRKVTDILGIEGGYQYVDSPVIAGYAGERPDPDSPRYVPTTVPGARIPHVWLSDGSALHDRLGQGFTLLRLQAPEQDARGLARGFATLGAPLEIVDVPDAAARDLYEAALVLVRPDLHVAWRGDAPPADPHALAARVTGH